MRGGGVEGHPQPTITQTHPLFLFPATHSSPQLQLQLGKGKAEKGGENRSSSAQSSKISAKDNAN